jgi:hypothetical protein
LAYAREGAARDRFLLAFLLRRALGLGDLRAILDFVGSATPYRSTFAQGGEAVTSYYEKREREHRRSEWAGFLALACGVPVLFFTLAFLLQWIAGWFA